MVRRNVNGVGGRVMAYGQTQVCDTAGPVLLHKNVFRLQVSVGNGGLSWGGIIKGSIKLEFELETDEKQSWGFYTWLNGYFKFLHTRAVCFKNIF